MNWLFKEEPTHYSFDDFVKDGKTSWTGVKNPLAQKHLRSVKKGDKVFYYHTGDEKAVVGICKAAGAAYVPVDADDPDDGDAPEFNSVDASLWFVLTAQELIDRGAADNWDSHSDMKAHEPLARAVVEHDPAATVPVHDVVPSPTVTLPVVPTA